MRVNVMPGARPATTVVTRLIAPRALAVPARRMATMIQVWPAPGAPLPVDSGGKLVHPAEGAPLGAASEASAQSCAAAVSQKEAAVRRGSAVPRAPIDSGTTSVPTAPMRIGAIATKIITRPGVVKSTV